MIARGHTLAVLTCLLIFLCGQVPSAAAIDCTITTARSVRTFYSGENVCLNIHAMVTPQTVPYEVRDFEGQMIAEGALQLSDTCPEVLQLGDLANGIYYLSLTFEGPEVVNDAFCVIPRPDEDPGDPALWGFQFGSMSDPHFKVMAQVGVRYVRFDMSWPDHERQEGSYNTGKADWFAATVQRYGLQMIPTLGYSPVWTGLKPDNMADVRSHTWCPDAVEHWGDYVAVLRDRLASQTVPWPSPEIVPSGAGRENVPLVRAWEIWNEADQNFYYGPWCRYADLLRIASKTIEQHSYHDDIIYGGACAHWTEMGKIYGLGAQAYFDQIAWHSNRDIEQELPKYYYGSPQLGYKFLLPRPTIQTECYPDTKPGVSEAEYLLRLYATLKAWREEGYCYSSIGQHLEGPVDPNSRALVYRKPDGEFVPNAKYVAYAVTRWLLADAAYLGPLNLGDGIRAHLFAKQRKALLIAWCDHGATVAVDIEPGATRIDIMGRKHVLSGGQCSLALTGAPAVVFGVGESHILEAIENYFEQVMTTEYGFEYHVDAPYVKKLDWDCNWGCSDQASRMRATLRSVLKAMRGSPIANVRHLDRLIGDIRRSMKALARAAISRQIIRPEVPTSIWRLQKLAEWLAEARDTLALEPGIQGGTAQALWGYLEQARPTLVDRTQGTTYPFSELLLKRAFRMAKLSSQTQGRGSYLVARAAARTGLLFREIERPCLTDVFVVGHFPTARQMIRGILFHPGLTHTLEAQVYNFTPDDVSGTLTWTLPGTWSEGSISLPFTAPAGGHTERLPCQVDIPGTPAPWVLKWTYVPGYRFCVSLPETIASEGYATLSAELSDGRQTLPVPHEICVGVWVPEGSP